MIGDLHCRQSEPTSRQLNSWTARVALRFDAHKPTLRESEHEGACLYALLRQQFNRSQPHHSCH